MSHFPELRHDHLACVAHTLERAEALSAARGAKFTPLRRRVLEIVLGGHEPVGAYDVLGALARDGTRPAPPTVYRALDFLRDQGFVHRIDSRNAFIGCFAPRERHRGHFLLCSHCGRAAEIDDRDLDTALSETAERAGFEVEGETVEISGCCGACRARVGELC